MTPTLFATVLWPYRFPKHDGWCEDEDMSPARLYIYIDMYTTGLLASIRFVNMRVITWI